MHLIVMADQQVVAPVAESDLPRSSETGGSSGNLSSLSSSEQNMTTVSILDRLHCSKPSELARKRKVDHNPPPKGKRKSYGCGTSRPKSVSPKQRVTEHPGEYLTVSNKQLFCRAYREELSLISSVINNHVKSAKHLAGKKRLGSKDKTEHDIVEALKASDQVTHPVGETLPQDERVYRVKVVTAFL